MLEREINALPWAEVASTNVKRLAYMEDPPALYVEFHAKPGEARAIGRYGGVERDRYEAVRRAESVGSMLHKLVAKKSEEGRFEYERLDVEPDPLPDDTELFVQILQELRNLNGNMVNFHRLMQGALRPRATQPPRGA
jgi:hypothetical protein